MLEQSSLAIILNQNGLEWNDDQGCLVGGTSEDCGRKDCNLCQAPTAMCMVTASRSSTLHKNAGQNWVQLFPFLFRSLIVW